MAVEGKKRALILIADGSEDVEVVIPAYIFHHGDMETVIASINGDGLVECVEGLKIKPTMSIEDARKNGPFDVVFLPGGIRGAPSLAGNKQVEEILRDQEKNNRIVGAICFSPACSVAKFGIYEGRKITCYPNDEVKKIIFDNKTYTFVDEEIVEDGNLITAQGPAFAIGIALAILRKVSGEEKVTKVQNMMLLNKK